MTIGTLTATLGLDSDQAAIGMSQFQKQMLVAVTQINRNLSAMAASMTKVGTASVMMGNTASNAFKKITIASKTASVTTGEFAGSFAAKITNANAAAAASITNVGNVSTIARAKIATVSDSIQKVNKTTEASMKSVVSNINNVSQKFRTFGYLATATLTVPILAFGKASFTAASDFEYSMQKIVGLTGTAQESVDKFKEKILELAPALGKTPQELAEGLYYISSSGIKGSEAMNALILSAKAAASGLGETQSVADYLTSSLNAYAGTGLKASYATDVLAAGVREGKAEAAGFASNVGQLIPLASNLGVSLDQVVGGMSAITLTGSSASSASVYLKGVFNSLITASEQGAIALSRANTSYDELRYILKNQGLIALMQKLRDVQLKYGDEAIKDVLPNIRALTGYMSIAGKNFQYNTELMQRVTDATGSLNKAHVSIADTIKQRTNVAMASLNASTIKIGETFKTTILPIIESVVGKISDLADWYSDLDSSTRKLITSTALLVAALGPLSLIISVIGYLSGGLVTTFNVLTKTFTFFKGIIFGLSGSFGGLKTAMTISPTITKGLFSVFKFLSGSGLGIGSLITILGGATVGLVKYSNHVKEIAKKHSLFYSSLVDVNGELKRMKDLSDVDYGVMSIEQLTAAQEAARKAWDQSYKEYNQGVKNKEGYSFLENLFGAGHTNQKFIDARAAEVTKAKKIYDDLAAAISKYNTEQDAAKKAKILQDAIKNYETTIGPAIEIFSKLNEGMELNHRMAALLGDDFDYAKENTELFEKTLKELAGTTIPITDSRMQELAKAVKQVVTEVKAIPKADYMKALFSDTLIPTNTKADIGDVTTTLNKMNSELAAAALKESLLGDTFDEAKTQMSVYENAIDTLTDKLALLKEWNVEPGDVEYDAYVDAIKSITSEYNKLANSLDKISAKKEALNNIMDIMSTVGSYIGGTFSEWIGYLEDVINLLPKIISLTKLFSAEKATETAITTTNTATQLTNAASLATAQAESITATTAAQAESVANAGNAISGATASGARLPYPYNLIAMASGVETVLTSLASIPVAQGMAALANGGIVPDGYPNDSFYARLSSQEAVIPLEKMDRFQNSDMTGLKDVVFHIEGDTLVGVFKNYNRKVKSYS